MIWVNSYIKYQRSPWWTKEWASSFNSLHVKRKKSNIYEVFKWTIIFQKCTTRKLKGKNKLLKNSKRSYFNIENWIIIRETQLRSTHNDTEN